MSRSFSAISIKNVTSSPPRPTHIIQNIYIQHYSVVESTLYPPPQKNGREKKKATGEYLIPQIKICNFHCKQFANISTTLVSL